VFLGAAVMLFIVEVFVPSGGILAIASATSALVGIVLLFWVDTTVGLVGMIVVIVATPVLLGFALRIWPHTPLGRALTLSAGQSALTRAAKPDMAGTPAPPDERVGQRGTAMTDLRPVGTCLIAGERVECLSARGIIRKGATVTVVEVDGNSIRVEPVEDV